VSAAVAVERWSRLADRWDAVRSSAAAMRDRITAHADEITRLEMSMRVDSRDAIVEPGADGLAYASYLGSDHGGTGRFPMTARLMARRGVQTKTRRPEFDDQIRRITELETQIGRLRGEAQALMERNAGLGRIVNEGKDLLTARRIKLPPR
jgi:hypothetical protein